MILDGGLLRTLRFFLSCLCIISMAFDIYYIAVPVCGVLLFISPLMKIRFDLSQLFLLLSAICFLTSFLYFPERLFLPNAIASLLKYIIFIVILYVVFKTNNCEHANIIKIIFGVSLLTRVLIISLFSYLMQRGGGDIEFGYGRVYDPFIQQVVLSPKIALLAVAGHLVILSCGNINNKYKIFSALILCLVVIYLQSRAAFFIFVLFIPFLGINKKYFLALAIVLLIALPVYYDNLLPYIDGSRLVSAGIESKRYMHWSDGVLKFIDYPMGGFSVNPSIENVNFFHSIILDSARINGIYSTFFLLIVFFLIVKISFYNKKGVFIIGIIALMFQDVVIEGNFLLFISMFIISEFWLSRDKLND